VPARKATLGLHDLRVTSRWNTQAGKRRGGGFTTSGSRSLDGGPYYDIRSDYSVIYLGESPAVGESFILEYATVHAIPSTDATVLTIPANHLELLRLYIVWKAVTQLEMDENVSVDRKREMMSALGLNAFRAERAYKGRMREIVLTYTHGIAGQWRMDKRLDLLGKEYPKASLL
jgi:hypothetical protein